MIEDQNMSSHPGTQGPVSPQRAGVGRGAPITEKAAALAHEAVDAASERAEDMERRLRTEAARVADKVEEGEARARHQIDETLASVETFIRDRPVAAAGMAFAAGMFAAMLMRR